MNDQINFIELATHARVIYDDGKKNLILLSDTFIFFYYLCLGTRRQTSYIVRIL